MVCAAPAIGWPTVTARASSHAPWAAVTWIVNGMTVPQATPAPTLNRKCGAGLAPVPPPGTSANEAVTCVIVIPGALVSSVPWTAVAGAGRCCPG